MTKSTCSVQGCGNPMYGLGFCKKHWHRNRRHGDPLGGQTGRGEAVAAFERLAAIDSDECVLWPYSVTAGGYGQLWIARGNRTEVHILVCEQHHGPRPVGAEAAHDNNGQPCVSRRCMNWRHLRWATQAENRADQIAHGTLKRGTQLPGAKLTEADVRDIRRRRADGELLTSIADDYGLHFGYVSLIALRRRWAWLPD